MDNHLNPRHINFQNMVSLHLCGMKMLSEKQLHFISFRKIVKSNDGYCVLGETNRSICFLYQKLMMVWIHQSVLVIFVYSNVSIEEKKYLLGRVVHFSYLSGSKLDRHYTSTYVDMTKEIFKTIGAFVNWYIGVYSDASHMDQVLPFMPFENFFL